MVLWWFSKCPSSYRQIRAYVGIRQLGPNLSTTWWAVATPCLGAAPKAVPGKLVACNYGLLSIDSGLLWDLAACFSALPGFPGRYARSQVGIKSLEEPVWGPAPHGEVANRGTVPGIIMGIFLNIAKIGVSVFWFGVNMGRHLGFPHSRHTNSGCGSRVPHTETCRI